MPVQNQLVQVGGLLGGEAVQAQVVQDEQVRGQEGPEGAVHRVVHPGLGHGPEEAVGMNETDSVSGADERWAGGDVGPAAAGCQAVRRVDQRGLAGVQGGQHLQCGPSRIRQERGLDDTEIATPSSSPRVASSRR